MDFDSLLSRPRWDILETVAKQPSSPLELSGQLNTSVSYISQQLKLLEAAGLVVKEKTGKADKGKPRSVYSISNEFIHLTALTRGWANKKLVPVEPHHKHMLRIWSIDNTSLHHGLSAIYWKIEQYLEEMDGLFFESIKGKHKVIVVTSSKRVKSKIEQVAKEFHDLFTFSVLSQDTFTKNHLENVIVIHDPHSIQSSFSQMKGGTQ